jgi:hypothetical protein
MGVWDWLVGGSPDKQAYTPAHQQQALGAITPGMQTNYNAQQFAPGGQIRQSQLGQIGQLQGIASGQQQGAGELAAQRQTQNALAAQQAQARMARGGQGAFAYRNAGNNAAAIGLSGAGMAQQAGMQDQMAAQGMLTNAMGQARGQDLSALDQQLRAMGMQDQTRLAYLGQLTGMDAAQLQAYGQANAQTAPGHIGPLIGAAGQVGAAIAMSDERVKEQIEDAGDEVDQALEALLPKAYVYKDQGKHGQGRRVGIMAQDLERSRAGSHVVTEVKDGKAIDLSKATSLALASVARLHHRLRKIEGGSK